jgi:phage baseplate assembly protein W
MATFVGFNTVNQFKKFTLTDFELIKRDLINAFNIRQGEKPGRPAYGTTLWDFIFESLDQVTETAILAEVQRVAGQDPRIFLQDAAVYARDQGILIELSVAVVPSADAERLAIFFDLEQRRASFV